MATSQSWPEIIGKAMHLPAVFYEPLPLSKLLEIAFPLRAFGSTSRRQRRRRRFQHSKRPAGAPAKRTSQSQEQFLLEGTVEAGSATKFAIAGIDFVVTPTTWIIGEIKVGSMARVKGTVRDDDGNVASSVVMLSLAMN